jgi:hypothetical protein
MSLVAIVDVQLFWDCRICWSDGTGRGILEGAALALCGALFPFPFLFSMLFLLSNVCVCVFVCVRAREREKGRGRYATMLLFAVSSSSWSCVKIHLTVTTSLFRDHQRCQHT